MHSAVGRREVFGFIATISILKRTAKCCQAFSIKPVAVLVCLTPENAHTRAGIGGEEVVVAAAAVEVKERNTDRYTREAISLAFPSIIFPGLISTFCQDGSKIPSRLKIDGPGVWVSCVKGKERQTVGELYSLFESVRPRFSSLSKSLLFLFSSFQDIR